MENQSAAGSHGAASNTDTAEELFARGMELFRQALQIRRSECEKDKTKK